MSGFNSLVQMCFLFTVVTEHCPFKPYHAVVVVVVVVLVDVVVVVVFVVVVAF